MIRQRMHLILLRIRWFLWNWIIDAWIPVPTFRRKYIGVDVDCLRLTIEECDELDASEAKP